MRRSTSFLFCLLLIPSLLKSAVYYIDPNGSDTNTGIQTKPWQTLYHALPLLNAGDTCYVNPGYYSNPVHDISTGTAAGTPSSPITVVGLPGSVISDSGIFVGSSNWVFTGITISNFFHNVHLTGGFVIGSTAHHTFIHDCTIEYSTNGDSYGVIWYADPALMDVSHGTNNPIIKPSTCAHDCIISNNILDTMVGEFVNMSGSNNIVVNNTLRNGYSSDVFQFFGCSNIIRGNFVTNFYLIEGIGEHPDMFQSYSQNGNPVDFNDAYCDSYNQIIEGNQFWDCKISFGQFEGGDSNNPPIVNFGNFIFRNNLYVRCGNAGGSMDSMGAPAMQWVNNTYILCATNSATGGSPIMLLMHSVADCGNPHHYRGEATNFVVLNNAMIACGQDTNIALFSVQSDDSISTNGYWRGIWASNYVSYWNGTNLFRVSPKFGSMPSFDTCTVNNTTNYYHIFQFPPDINTGADPKMVQLFYRVVGRSDCRPMLGSPLIGAGTNASAWCQTDIEGNGRPLGSAYDVGCFEYDPSLKLRFDFNENFSQGKVLDVTGNTNDGWNMNVVPPGQLVTNWITQTSGAFPNSFAGLWTSNGVMTNDPGQTYAMSTYLAVTNLNGFQYLTNGTISVWAWFTPNSDYAIRLLDNGFNQTYATGVSSNSWMLGRNYATTLSFTVYPGGGGISNVLNFPDDVIKDQGSAPYNFGTTNWHLYTITVSCPSNQIIAYYDGQPWQTNSINLPWLRVYGCGSQPWLCVGAMSHDGTPQWGDDSYPNDGFMEGRMDDLRIYNRTLSAGEVCNLYVGAGSGNVSGSSYAAKPQPPQNFHIVGPILP